MLQFFRRFTNSRLGVVVTLGVLVVIALAFAAGDVSGLRTAGMSALAGDKVAGVAGRTITATELRDRAATEFEAARQQQPQLTMAQFVAGGGVDGTLQRLVTGAALERFARDTGMVVSRRAVDGALASIPGLQGIDGKFDPVTYQRLLASRKLTDGQVRAELVQQILAEQLTAPTVLATQVPAGLARPYAALLLERRAGAVGFVAARPAAVATPSDADLQAFYARERARYRVPQRRVLRYALVSPAAVAARAAPTDAEVAAYYAAHRSAYAAAEQRAADSVVVPDQAGAAALVARVKAGATLADAARAAGLEAASQPAGDKAAIAAALSPAVADAVFAAARGAVVGPVKAPLGYVVARVTGVNQVAGRSLDQARAGIAAELAKAKSLKLLGSVHDAMDDQLGRNATFDEVLADQKLTGQTTAPLLASGADPDHPDAKPDPALAPLLAAAFKAEDGDPPQLVPTGPDSFALVALGRVVPAADRPLAAVRGQVARDLAAERARSAARTAAAAVVARANAGTPFAQALAGAGLPPAKPVQSTRAQLAAAPGGQPPAPLVLLFGMRPGATRLLEAPNGAGFFVIHLDQVTPGNPAGDPALVAQTRADLGRAVGREYAEEFARALRAAAGASIDQAALARVKAELASGRAGQ